MDWFLSQWWAGIAIALVLSFVGLFFVMVSRLWMKRRSATGMVLLISGWLLSFVGPLLLAGATLAVHHRSAVIVEHPAPGKLVDVGGFRIHLFAEGQASSASATTKNPILVWLPGGYGPGLWMQHLHDRFKEEYRSVLFDRAGSGWSDVGPIPRTQDRLAEELALALKGSGEPGPFVVIGHSAGGLQAAHFAHRYPELTAGVVVLDGTSPLHLAIEGRRYWSMRSWSGEFLTLGALFGGDVLFPNVHPLRADGAKPKSIDPMTWNLLVEFEARPSALTASHSLASSDSKACFDMVRGRNILGDIPLLSVMQADRTNEPKAIESARQYYGLNDEELKVWKAYHKDVLLEYSQMSRQGRLIEAPEKMTHLFPNEEPEFTEKCIREFLVSLPTSSPSSKTSTTLMP